MSDDLLREASDPTTSGARLRALWELAAFGLCDATLTRCLALNPSLPMDLLAERLKNGNPHAWRNPAVPLLLQSEPLPEYERGASAAVVALARTITDGNLQPVTDLARYLAGFFGPEWPTP